MSEQNKKPSAAEEFEKSEVSFKTAEKAKDDALLSFTQLSETASDEQRDSARKLMDDTRTAFEEIEKSHGILIEKRDAGKTRKVKILLPVAGLFYLPYDIGQVVDLPENQAKEIVDAKYAEFVK